MARVLILEPSAEVRDLLCHHVRHLGHEPVLPAEEGEPLPHADIVLVEPGDADFVELVHALRRTSPALPVICVSVYPRDRVTNELGPVAHVLKPFKGSDIRAALQGVLGEATPASRE